MKRTEANDLLPDNPTKSASDPTKLKYLYITPPKWGKTTTLCQIPNSVLLATEEGHAFHEGIKIIIDCWDYPSRDEREELCWGIDDQGNTHASMVAAAEALAASDKYDFIGLDTVDMAAKMCLDYHLAKLRVAHASDAGDYGKGWDISLNQPFRKMITLLLKTGRGVGFTTHLNLIEKKIGNETKTRWETTLPGGVQKFLHTQADIIIHGMFGKHRKGMEERDRVVVLDGSNEILAGSRVRGIHLPKKYIVDPDKPWEQWIGFFEDEDNVNKADADYQRLVLGGRESEDEDLETEKEKPAKEKDKEKISSGKAPEKKPAARSGRRN